MPDTVLSAEDTAGRETKPPSLCSNEWSVIKLRIRLCQRFPAPHTTLEPHGKCRPWTKPSINPDFSWSFLIHFLTGNIKGGRYLLNTWLGRPTARVLTWKLSTYLWLYFSCFSSVHFPRYHLLLLLLPPMQRILPNFHLPLWPSKNY